MNSRILQLLALVLLATAMTPSWGQQGRWLTVDEFLEQGGLGESPQPQVLWLTPDLREQVEKVLGRSFRKLRLRYWHEQATTAWILEEIGKEKPITIGITVTNEGISKVSILEYRESRGGEVRYDFFTDQFKNAQLKGKKKLKLDRHIDGITGATLSVRAVTKVSTVALLLHQQVESVHNASTSEISKTDVQ